jgi:hypothetical protein
MATKARRTTVARSSGRKKKGRGALWLVAGLLLGAALMYGAQHLLYRDGKPFRGLAGLVDSGAKAIGGEGEPKPEPQAERPPKPKFDFYKILPEIETVLPEPPKGNGKKSAKAEPPEAGVSYVLQAASYDNANDADRLKARLALNGFEAYIEKVAIQGKGDYYRVRLGPYARIDELDAANARLEQLGIKPMRIKVKKTAG